MVRFFPLIFLMFPGIALAAAGGVGDGFGADDWIRKWPVLLIVFCVVVGMTTFLSIKIFGRARAQRGEE